jgi:hypothetical protein
VLIAADLGGIADGDAVDLWISKPVNCDLPGKTGLCGWNRCPTI